MKAKLIAAIVPAAAVAAIAFGSGTAVANPVQDPAAPVTPGVDTSPFLHDAVLGMVMPGEQGQLCKPYLMIPIIGMPMFNLCFV